MNENRRSLGDLREKWLSYNEKTLRTVVLFGALMYFWLLIWALVFKLCNEEMMTTNYWNLTALTLKERIEWDLIPFQYHGEGLYRIKQIITTVLNCFVFAPFGVLFPLLFKKLNALRDALICLLMVTVIEVLQMVTIIGNFSTEDFITNVVGYFIGLLIYFLFFKRLRVKTKVVFFSIANLILAAGVIYSIVTFIGASETIYAILTRTL